MKNNLKANTHFTHPVGFEQYHSGHDQGMPQI
jgi:hypothetical protein